MPHRPAQFDGARKVDIFFPYARRHPVTRDYQGNAYRCNDRLSASGKCRANKCKFFTEASPLLHILLQSSTNTSPRDQRIQTLIRNGLQEKKRGFFVVVGDRAKDVIVHLHYIMSSMDIKQNKSVLWAYKSKLLGFTR